jgi:hypothetical protein
MHARTRDAIRSYDTRFPLGPNEFGRFLWGDEVVDPLQLAVGFTKNSLLVKASTTSL